MSVTIANTDAQLSGKTLVTTDANQTIDGLKTYDRGTSAPFAVVSGAAKVANLDADMLDGETAADFHDAAQLTGNVALARIPDVSLGATGTPDATTYLRGDRTWAVVEAGLDMIQIEALS